MEFADGTLSRRNLLTVSGLAAGALAAKRTDAEVPASSALIAPVSVAKITS